MSIKFRVSDFVAARRGIARSESRQLEDEGGQADSQGVEGNQVDRQP